MSNLLTPGPARPPRRDHPRSATRAGIPRRRLFLALAASSALLTACGQMGPLYQPDEEAPAAPRNGSDDAERPDGPGGPGGPDTREGEPS